MLQICGRSANSKVTMVVVRLNIALCPTNATLKCSLLPLVPRYPPSIYVGEPSTRRDVGRQWSLQITGGVMAVRFSIGSVRAFYFYSSPLFVASFLAGCCLPHDLVPSPSRMRHRLGPARQGSRGQFCRVGRRRAAQMAEDEKARQSRDPPGRCDGGHGGSRLDEKGI
jgi:hypothetical protein